MDDHRTGAVRYAEQTRGSFMKDSNGADNQVIGCGAAELISRTCQYRSIKADGDTGPGGRPIRIAHRLCGWIYQATLTRGFGLRKRGSRNLDFTVQEYSFFFWFPLNMRKKKME